MNKELENARTERNKVIIQARELVDKAKNEKRSLSAEEEGKYQELMDKQEELRVNIKREEDLIAAERSVAEKQIETRETNDNPVPSNNPLATPEYRAAYEQHIRYGKDGLSADDSRALSAGVGTEGGFLTMPVQMVAALIQAIDDLLYIRGWATKFSVPNAASLGAASLDADPDDADWTAEIATGNEDGAMKFGKRELAPKPLAKRIKLSNKLLRMVPGVEGIVTSRLAYKFALTMEKAFLLGSGANQPLGVFVASPDGISTGRDVATDNTATAITMNGLVNAKYSVKAQYQRVGQWLFHRDAVKMIAKLTDLDGQYLWQPSKSEKEPDMLLGRPMNMSEHVPNTFTTGLYVGMFGDFSKYWIADALDIQLQRLVELYAEANQTGFIGRMESDGMPVLEEAFARVTLA